MSAFLRHFRARTPFALWETPCALHPKKCNVPRDSLFKLIVAWYRWYFVVYTHARVTFWVIIPGSLKSIYRRIFYTQRQICNSFIYFLTNNYQIIKYLKNYLEFCDVNRIIISTLKFFACLSFINSSLRKYCIVFQLLLTINTSCAIVILIEKITWGIHTYTKVRKNLEAVVLKNIYLSSPWAA